MLLTQNMDIKEAIDVLQFHFLHSIGSKQVALLQNMVVATAMGRRLRGIDGAIKQASLLCAVSHQFRSIRRVVMNDFLKGIGIHTADKQPEKPFVFDRTKHIDKRAFPTCEKCKRYGIPLVWVGRRRLCEVCALD